MALPSALAMHSAFACFVRHHFGAEALAGAQDAAEQLNIPPTAPPIVDGKRLERQARAHAEASLPVFILSTALQHPATFCTPRVPSVVRWA